MVLEETKSILLSDPNIELEKDRNLVSKPFYFQGKNGKAVLLVHGWTSTPYEVRRLGKYLSEKGYTAYGPLLTGHGKTPKDLYGVKWKSWIKDVEVALKKLRKKHNKVYLCGTSLGGNIAIYLASKRNDIDGLILLATPVKFKQEKLGFIAAKIANLFKKYNKKIYPPGFGPKLSVTRMISYQVYPIKSLFEAFALIKKSSTVLEKVKQPCLMIQSDIDHLVVKNNLEILYESIGSEIKEKKYINEAYHTFISDIKNSHIFKDIYKFINEN